MDAKAVTVGIPVRDIDRATEWYRAALSLGEPDQIPLDGLVEFDLGPFWLQLAAAPDLAGREGISVNISVADATALRRDLESRGLTVGEMQRFEGVVEFFELIDPDGNKIGFVTELA